MRRKFTVYGLRFSKTSFWNRINTGFLDPAVATVLTACGIETGWIKTPLLGTIVCCNSAYRLRYWNAVEGFTLTVFNTLQHCLPLAVLKRKRKERFVRRLVVCCNSAYRLRYWNSASILSTAFLLSSGCNSAYRLRYWNYQILVPFYSQ